VKVQGFSRSETRQYYVFVDCNTTSPDDEEGPYGPRMMMGGIVAIGPEGDREGERQKGLT
jgi:hypothetical protein